MESGPEFHKVFPRVQLHLCLDNEPRIISLPYEKLRGSKSPKEIITEIISETGISPNKELVLRIKSTDGLSVIMEDEDRPMRMCTNLIVLPRGHSLQEQFQPYYLHLSYATSDNNSVIRFPVTNDKGEYLYVTKIEINRQNKKNTIMERVIRFLRKLHNKPVQVENLLPLHRQDISDDTHFLNALFRDRIYAWFACDQNDIKLIEHRKKAITEFITTERNYLDVLAGYETHVKSLLLGLAHRVPTMKEDDVLNMIEHTMIMRKHHQAFLNNLESSEVEFMTELGKCWKDHVEYIKLYARYTELYCAMKRQVDESSTRSENKALFKDFENKMSESIDSILIKPPQKMGHYRELLKKLMAYTPAKHPDHKLLLHIFGKFVMNADEVDFKGNRTHRDEMLTSIEKRFNVPARLRERSNEYIKHYIVQHNQEKYIHILLTDKFVTAKITDEDYYTHPKYYNYEDINVEEYGGQSVILRSVRNNLEENIKYLFEDVGIRAEFVGKLKKTIISYQQNRMKDQITLVWKSNETERALAYHNMVVCQDRLWLFGGKDPEGKLNGTLRAISIKDNMKWLRLETGGAAPEARFGAAMCASETTLYLFGGTTDGQTPLSDFWMINVDSKHKNKWIKITPSDDVWPTASLGLHMEFFDDRILLTGGSDTFRVYQYLIAENRWILTEMTYNLGPLTDHALTRVPGKPGWGLIVGGMRGKDPNNAVIMLYDYGKKSRFIKTCSLNPVNRVPCRACLVRNSVYVYGGYNLDSPIPYVLLLPGQCWTVPLCHFGGKLIPDLRGAAMAQIDDIVYIHGGEGSGSVYSEMYIVKNDKLVDEEMANIENQITEFDEDVFVRASCTRVEEETWVRYEDLLTTNATLSKSHIGGRRKSAVKALGALVRQRGDSWHPK